MTEEERAADIAAGFLERRERRERVDTAELFRAHPGLAGPLRAAFGALRRLDAEFAPARPAPSRVGRSLGPYLLERELGAGGMGTVYLASTTSGEPVAVKVLHPHLVARPDSVRRFLREAEIGRRVRHDNVVRTLDAVETADGGERLHVVVMEYVDGRTLRALSDELARLPEELCRRVGRDVGRALVAIHAAGAVHRDLKPDNVIVTPEQVVKVMDLGVARLVDESLRVSQSGTFVGSVRYASPEQLGSDEVDGRADLYALGLTLYELATGVHPFAGDDFRAVLKKQMSETPRPAGELNPQLSPFFEDLVARLVEKDRDRRIASAADLVRILDEGEESAWWRERRHAIRAATRRPLRRIRIPRETALYGRESELAKLRELFEGAKAGDGQVLVVEGEAGIGKSRLVDEFVGALAQSGEDVNFLFGSYPPGGAATASGAFSVAYREHLGDDEDAVRAALPRTPLLVPAFAALLRGEVAPQGAEPLTKDSLQTVFVHATRSFAAQRPTIVLIDDLHFAPEEGRALFASLALAVPGDRVLLVGCARPSLDEKWLAQLASRPQTTRLALPRLGPKELVHLLRDALRSERLAEELAGLIAVKSDGNPFFVFELLRGLRDGQFLRQRPDGTWETTQVIRDIQVPSSIAQLVQARVADLDAEDKNLLDIAACCGFEFDPLVVAAAHGTAEIPALQRLARIEQRHRLVRSAGRRFVFDHHQVQEALYAGLPELLRERYHAAIGEAVETQTGAAAQEPKDVDGAVCVDLAEHFLKGARGERALRYLDAALSYLEKGYLIDAEIRLTDRALEMRGLLTESRRCSVLLCKARALDVVGRPLDEHASLEEANSLADETGDSVLRAQSKMSLGWFLVRRSRHNEARALLEESTSLTRGTDDELLCAVFLGTLFLETGQCELARVHFDRAMELALLTGDERREADAASGLARMHLALGQFEAARSHLDRHLEIAQERGSSLGLANTRIGLGLVCFGQHRLADMRTHLEIALTISRGIGARKTEAVSLVNLGKLWLVLGDSAQARDTLTTALGLMREIDARLPEGYALESLGAVADACGDRDAALRLLEESLALRRAIGHAEGVADSLIELGDLRRRAGEVNVARAVLDEAVALSRERGFSPQSALAAASLACLLGDDTATVAGLADANVGAEVHRIWFLLWQATGDRAQLIEAKRVLDRLVQHAPPEYRESMLTNVRIHREIAAAAREHEV